MEKVIWEQCWSPGFDVPDPTWTNPGRTKHIGVDICGRLIVLANGQLQLELQVAGERRRFDIAQACYPAFTVGIASVNACAEPLIENGHLKGVKLTIKACIGINVLGHNFEQCWDLFSSVIGIASFTAQEIAAASGIVLSASADSDKRYTFALPGVSVNEEGSLQGKKSEKGKQ
jgi:hypothetical protein